MSFLTSNHKQTIVYWGTPTKDKWGGRTFATPVEITGRWEDNQEVFIDGTGREAVSKAFVYIGQDVDLEGYLYLGTLASISSAASPKAVDGAFEVRAFNKIPNLKATDFERKAIL
jgi:hypothetical protein